MISAYLPVNRIASRPLRALQVRLLFDIAFFWLPLNVLLVLSVRLVADPFAYN